MPSRYLAVKDTLAAVIWILPSENTLTFKIQVEVESLSLTATLLVCLLLSLSLWCSHHSSAAFRYLGSYL